MDARLGRLAARAATHHNVITRADFAAEGISRQLRADWLALGVIERLGVNTFGIAGAPRSWKQGLMAGLLGLGPAAVIAGHAGGALLGLDGFRPGSLDFLGPRSMRDRMVTGKLVTTTRAIPVTDICRIDGLRCLRAERLILEAPLFGFTKSEIENAIDSSMRLRLVAEEPLRRRVLTDRSLGVNNGRMVLDALVDAGGHSALERAFLRILREAGLPRPALQVKYRDGSRIVARVDTQYGEELIIEVAGHKTHSSRRQIQIDEQRRTELTLRGKRVIGFTYDDVMDRPEWTVDRVREALSGCVVSA